jgi:ABC-type multidrug transport system fused ATPase/permease subunit
LEKEAPEFIEPRPAASWPHDGAISVEKLTIRYAVCSSFPHLDSADSQPDLPNVLHGISFDVAPKQKIGIVGATGCGKSTLALSFFRFVEAHAGRIVIDGLGMSSLLRACRADIRYRQYRPY